ncbi:hypothetical protein [Amycolatopsis sp.]|uniref:restriction system modified-DNA reader domain-containing protein n=1 Tax=Amycolatopsis sp. TaxID=37632 RepID=UPI00345AD338
MVNNPPFTLDLDLFEYLRKESYPLESVNDVLRRLLKPEQPRRRKVSTSTGNLAQRRPGALMPLLDAGLVEANDDLIHEQPRKGLIHCGTILADGWVRVGGCDFTTPSPALRTCIKTQVDGWARWTHQRSGHSLKALRATL